MLVRITEDVVVDLDHVAGFTTLPASTARNTPVTRIYLAVGHEAREIDAKGLTAEDLMSRLEDMAREEYERDTKARDEFFENPYPGRRGPYGR